jgi:hypothetical protein
MLRPEFRSAFVACVEWGTRLAQHNSQPGAEIIEQAPVPHWVGARRRRSSSSTVAMHTIQGLGCDRAHASLDDFSSRSRLPSQDRVEVREAVAPHLEPAAADDLGELMTERNRLAHRFLRERSADDDDFLPGTYELLIAIGSRFMASLEAAKRVIDGFESYRRPVLAHWGALADRITKRLSAGEVVPRDPRLQ